MKEKKKIVTVRLPLDEYAEIAYIAYVLHKWSIPSMIRFMLRTWPSVMADYCEIHGFAAIPRWMERFASEITCKRKELFGKPKSSAKSVGKILAFPGK